MQRIIQQYIIYDINQHHHRRHGLYGKQEVQYFSWWKLACSGYVFCIVINLIFNRNCIVRVQDTHISASPVDWGSYLYCPVSKRSPVLDV